MTQVTSAGTAPPEASSTADTPPSGRLADPRGGGASGTGSALRLVAIPVDRVSPNPRQPRSVFDEDALAELADSISQVGLLQPIVVREAPAEPTAPVDDGNDEAGLASRGAHPTYELIAGERRWRSVRALGWDTVPALVRTTQDSDLLRDALIENLQRAQLNPLEEAAAFESLLADFGCTHEELAASVGRSRPHVSNTLRLLRLPPSVQRRVAAGVLSQGHARALLGLPDAESMERMATRIVAEGLSVRTVEELVTLGEVGDDEPRRPRRRTTPADLSEVARSLSDRLDTRVKVSMGRVKGRVTIEFAGPEDLDRILSLMTDDPS